MLDWDNLRFFLEVARTQRVSAAARRLKVQHTTVARRMRGLEQALDTLLFEKSRNTGFVLTEQGQRLMAHAEEMESALLNAREQISDIGQALTGHVRIGATEGFGTYVVAPLATDFLRRFPQITLDVLPVPRFVSLSKREADLAITLERPQRGPYVSGKLCDYALKLYGTARYLATHPPIAARGDLDRHTFIGYVDELIFSEHLRYLEDIVPASRSRVILRSTSVIAQYHAALAGHSLAILPCFIAAQDPRLVAVLPEEIAINRSFWMYCHEDLRKLKRIAALWDFMRESVLRNAALLDGTGSSLQGDPVAADQAG
jgi:DNA-binding transcriptional LysR family regulator